MSYATTLKYAGAKPYRPEEQREDITHEEYELLTQDETYRKLAEVRWLADSLEMHIATDTLANSIADDHDGDAHDAIFEAVAARDAPLQCMVERFVDAWLAEYRAQEEVSA